MNFWTSSKPGRLIVGGSIVVGYFYTFGLVIIAAGGKLPTETVRDLLFLYVGALIGAFTSVVAFFYGTTQSSTTKDSTIHELSKKEPTP